MTTLRHAVTAFALLIVVLAGVEIWMRNQSVPAAQMVLEQFTVEDQSLLIPNSICHHELRPSLEVARNGFGNSASRLLRVNSLGIRGEEPDVPAGKGTYRILVLGDDTICGAAVDESETIAARLRQFLSKETSAGIEVINGGIPGYCPLLSWLKFEHDLARLKPQLVILHVDMTDVADDTIYRSLLVTEENRVACPHTSLRLPPRPETQLMRFVKRSSTAGWLVARSRQYGLEMMSASQNSTGDDGALAWIGDHPPDLRLQVRHALSPIGMLKESVEQSGGQLLVTTAPVFWQILPAENAPNLSKRWGISGETPFSSQIPFDVIAHCCEQSQIRFFDSSSAFRGVQDATRLFSGDTPTLSRIGMALYAREIARYLVTNPPAKW